MNETTPSQAFIKGIRDYWDGIDYYKPPGLVCQALSHWQNGWLDALYHHKWNAFSEDGFKEDK